MKRMVKEIREIEKSLGSNKRILSKEEKNKIMIRRSIIASKILKKGEKVSLNKIKFKTGKGMLQMIL